MNRILSFRIFLRQYFRSSFNVHSSTSHSGTQYFLEIYRNERILRKLVAGILALGLTLFSVSPALASGPTQFLSPSYGIESVTFGGTGVLHSAADSIPPIILSGPTVSNITQTSATVTWTTDKSSNSLVYVGTTSGDYNIQAGDVVHATFTTHIVNMTFLKKGVTYFFKVHSGDIAGNIIESAEQSFQSDPGDITPPSITVGPIITQNSASSVTVSWETDEVANSIVQYGVKDVTENTAGHPDELTTFHQVAITVQTAQDYQLRVETKDASGNTTLSKILNLTTLSSPSITDAHINDVTLNSALVEWKTSVASTTRVSYGTQSGVYDLKSEDLTLTENHLVQLSGLLNGTTYYLRISGEDGAGNRISSDEYVFRTVILPTISNFVVAGITSYGASLTWTSSSDINTFVRYEIVKTDDPALNGKKLATGDDKLISAHSIDLADLESSTVYNVTVSGNDIFGNQALSPTLTFITAPDTTPPTIENLKTDTTVDLGSKQSVQILVSFGLSELGHAFIEYGAGATGNYDKKVETDTDLSTTKFLVIPGLVPGESYHFHIVATDRAGNKTTSPDYLALAPAAQPDVFSLILNQFKTSFGFLANL